MEKVGKDNINTNFKRITFLREGEEIEFRPITGEVYRYFPGETDLAGREVNEKLQHGTLEMEIHNLIEDEDQVFSFPDSFAAALIKELDRNGYDFDNPDEWKDLRIKAVRQSKYTFKVKIKDSSKASEVLEILNEFNDEELKEIKSGEDLLARVLANSLLTEEDISTAIKQLKAKNIIKITKTKGLVVNK